LSADFARAQSLLEARFGDLFENLPDAIVVVDGSGRIVGLNAMAEKIFGYEPRELLGQRVEALLPERFRAAHVGHRGDYFAHPRTRPMGVDLELFGRRKDGSEFPVEISLGPLETEIGLLAVTAIRDITDRKTIEEELRSASRMKSEFLATMSHELRTPLNVIIGFSEFLYDLKAGPLTDPQREYLGDVLNNARHLLRLISDVLDLSKIEAGRMRFLPETFDPRDAVQEACSDLRGIAQEMRVTIDAEVAPGIEAVRLDAHRFKQVLYNLISNAIKFSHPGGRVTVRLTAPAGFLRVEVADHGIGIEPQEIPQLFQSFHQIASGKGSPHQGAGLGLAPTKRIVELQRGTIEVETTPGEGSTFAVTLPLI
jgi:protein-histidine pros-kinase